MGSIKDKVAVIGVGATKFGEAWEKDAEDLLVDAAYEALDDAGLTSQDIEAAWVGVLYNFTGISGSTAAEPLKLFGKPVTRVENFCASGMDAFRNACYGVASGVYDIVLACGVEKLMDVGGSGLPVSDFGHPVIGGVSAPGMFALAATRSFHEWGWTKEDLARVAVKNHKNGVAHPKAHFRRAITMEDALNAPMIAWPLGRFDCCAMSDGSAAIVITRPEIAKTLKHKDDYVLVKANALAMATVMPMYKASFDYLGFPATRMAAASAYEEAGIKDPAQGDQLRRGARLLHHHRAAEHPGPGLRASRPGPPSLSGTAAPASRRVTSLSTPAAVSSASATPSAPRGAGWSTS